MTIRTTTEGDLPGLLDLWTSVFEKKEDVFTPAYRSYTPQSRRGFLAVAGEDRFVSAVQLFVGEYRDEQGRPSRVGCIANVATDPSFRGQGLSSQLLEQCIQAMRELRCEWSLLFTGVPNHYAKHGWRTIERTVWKTDRDTFRAGAGGSVLDGPPSGEVVDRMERLYTEATRSAPLAVVRTPLTWREKIVPHLSDEGRLVAAAPGGYAFARVQDDAFYIEEIVADAETERTLIGDLLSRTEAHEIVFEWKPGESFGLAEERRGAGMTLALDPAWTHERLQVLFLDPGARFSRLDGF